MAEGASVARITRELGVTRYAAKRALEREGLSTAHAARLAESRSGMPGHLRRACPRHGDSVYVRDTNGTFRCTRCSSEAVSKRRRRVKAALVAEAGGRCAECGYDRCVGALAFHHLDPRTKSFGLAEGGIAHSLDKAREETAKCLLLCANCHAEVEAGVRKLPGLDSNQQPFD